MPADQVIVVTGASSGFGAMTVRALADAGHRVYAGMRDTAGRNVKAAQEAADYASEHAVALHAIEMDVSEQASVDAAVETIITTEKRLDVIVHNAGHMVLGPLESFTTEQLVSIYDTNVVSTQRLNRAALPYLRNQRDGLVVWVGSTSTRGGTPPYLGPYFAAKGGGGRTCGDVRRRVGAFRHRDRHHRAGVVHEGNQPFRQRRASRRRRRGSCV